VGVIQFACWYWFWATAPCGSVGVDVLCSVKRQGRFDRSVAALSVVQTVWHKRNCTQSVRPCIILTTTTVTDRCT